MSSYEEMALQLRKAYKGSSIQPLREGLEPNDVDGAYAVQELNTRFWQSEGRKLVGRKIGLTSKAVQKQLGVGQPDFGALFEDMQISDKGMLPVANVIQSKAEAEIAFVLGKDLPYEDCTLDQIKEAIDYAVCAIEIVDSRISDWKITFADTVADNGSSAFYVLGQEKRKIEDVDLTGCSMQLKSNGRVVSTGTGEACLGNPLIATAWLAQTLAKRGQPLRSGDLVLSGALGPMISLDAGEYIQAQISGLGECSFYCV